MHRTDLVCPVTSRLGSVAIVCDVGGVILQDGMKILLHELSDMVGQSFDTIDSRYRLSGLRDRLWTGAISTTTFWRDLGRILECDLGRPEELDQRMIDLCRPLSTVSFLNTVGDRLWLATNHRTEWLEPALARSGLQLSRSRIVCSSNIGLCKPSVDFYRNVEEAIGGRADPPYVFFDDQVSNLGPAEELGWQTHLVGPAPYQTIVSALGA